MDMIALAILCGAFVIGISINLSAKAIVKAIMETRNDR